MSAWAGSTFFSQLFVVPALSYRLGLSDTVLIIISLTSAIVDTILETVMNQIWFLFVSWGVLQMLWSCNPSYRNPQPALQSTMDAYAALHFYILFQWPDPPHN